MTGIEFKRIRKALSLTQQGMAEALGLGVHGKRTVQRIEKGSTITGPMSLAVQALVDGKRP